MKYLIQFTYNEPQNFSIYETNNYSIPSNEHNCFCSCSIEHKFLKQELKMKIESMSKTITINASSSLFPLFFM